jgi:hypothetical protein
MFTRDLQLQNWTTYTIHQGCKFSTGSVQRSSIELKIYVHHKQIMQMNHNYSMGTDLHLYMS